MIGRVRRATMVSLVLGLAGWLAWQFSPLPAVMAITPLSDPAKLVLLGERGANPRLNKIMYWLDQARRRGLPPATTINLAQWRNGTRRRHAVLVRESLLNNLRRADEWGLFTPSNQEHLRRGQAAVIPQGPQAGETVEIDHIIPVSLAPEIGNELANLAMTPQPINRRKSNHLDQLQIEYAEKLHAAGLIKTGTLAAIKSQPAKGPANGFR